VTTLDRGEVASKRGKEGDDVSWADVNLNGPKNKKIHVIDLVAINGQCKFKAMMS
jgi:hypothetical protein